MARLFFSLYITIIGAVFAIFFAIDYVSSKHYYNVEIEQISKSVEAYSVLFDQIHTLGGEQTMFEAMHKALKAEDLLLEKVSKPDTLGLTEIKANDIFVKTGFAGNATVYMRMQDNQFYRVFPDKNSRRWQAEKTLGNIYMFGFFLTIALILGPWVYFLHRKLKILELSAIKIANGDFSTRVPEKFKHRVGGLNSAFNKMAERLEQLIASHQRLTNAVAHELRTPIFRLRCQAELLEYGTSEIDHKHYIEGIEEDLTELDQLVNEMLSFAKMELNEELFSLEPHELQSWLSDHRSILQRSCKKSLAIEIGPQLALRFDSRLIMRSLSNLVRNADTHSQEQIKISYLVREQYCIISVEDDGLGIPEDERNRVLDPFERLDDARTRESGGHGLGLSIVRAIVQQHGGKLLISQSSLGGACVSIYIPLIIK
ncbi:MAG: HAMP domain-containing protein [Oceanospirillaceae bacterium]|nr:HAMP domain-containing protein [Oceanospirillaceae bacterium]